MAITFTTATQVTAGTAPTSAQWNTLASAFNDRIKSGVGDVAWRAFWLAGSLFRNLISGAATDYFFTHLLHRPAGAAAPAGTLDPANPLASLLCGDCAGIGASSGSESEVLNSIPSGAFATVANAWALGQAQRGAVLAATGALEAPAYEVKQYLRGLYVQGADNDIYQAMLTAFGGVAGWKASGWPMVPLRDGLSAGSLAGVTGFNFAQHGYEVSYAGSAELRQYDDWLLWPMLTYAGPANVRAQIFATVCQWFASTFKGSDTQRAGDASWRIMDIAADFERFFSAQNRMAPAFGVEVGSVVSPRYPVFTFDATGGTLAAGTKAVCNVDAATHYAIHSGFALCAYRVVTTGLSEGVTVQIRANDVIAAAPVAGMDSVFATAGQDAQVWLDSFGLAPDMEWELIDALPAGATVTIEIAELTAEKPSVFDALILFRRIDVGGGWDYAGAKPVITTWISKGVLPAAADVAEVEPDDNNPSWVEHPIYQSSRRFLRERMRVARWDQLVEYEESGGKAVLTFQKEQDGFDAWDGLVGAITGTAPASGHSNEWVLFMTHHSPSSTNGDDGAWLFSRSHFLSTEIGGAADPPLDAFASMADSDLTNDCPKAPSGWNYFHGVNKTSDEDFFSSNPVYPKPYEVESVVAGETTVAITLKTALGKPVHSERTDHNALTDYVARRDDSTPCPVRTGDKAASAGSLAEGCCKTRFYFLRLAPKVYVGDGTYQTTCTRTLASDMQWLWFLLEAMAPGFVDPRALAGSVYQRHPVTYTLATLCHDVNNPAGTPAERGGQWMDILPEPDPTQRSLAPSRAQAFGPWPNTPLSAAQFNLTVRCINRLVKAAFSLPWEVEGRWERTWGRGTPPNYHVCAHGDEFNGAVEVPNASSEGGLHWAHNGADEDQDINTPGGYTLTGAHSDSGAGLLNAEEGCISGWTDPDPTLGILYGDHLTGLEHVYYYDGLSARAVSYLEFTGVPYAWEGHPKLLMGKTRSWVYSTCPADIAVSSELQALSPQIHLHVADTVDFYWHSGAAIEDVPNDSTHGWDLDDTFSMNQEIKTQTRRLDGSFPDMFTGFGCEIEPIPAPKSAFFKSWSGSGACPYFMNGPLSQTALTEIGDVLIAVPLVS